MGTRNIRVIIMSNQKKSIEELYLELHEIDKKSKRKPRILPFENGMFLLNPSNSLDVEWYENDQNYNLV